MSAFAAFSQFWRRFSGAGSTQLRLLLSAGSLLLLATAATVWGGPILHEHFRPDPEEDLRLGATNSGGRLPAAIQTKSGWVSAPDAMDQPRPSLELEAPYGAKQANLGSAFVLDNLTVKPRRVDYDEPFRPAILPYKRLFAFDAVDHNLALIVADRQLSELFVGGKASASDDVFFGDFVVDLLPNVAIRIPSVGPSARALALQVDPPRPLTLLHDGADNWFVRAKEGGRVRVIMQVTIARQTFGSQFLPVSRSALSPYLLSLPAEVVTGAAAVLAHIGDLGGLSPAGALRVLVDYFRSFHESDELPQSRTPLALYQEISLSQKGVCRHRAFAFVVTALAWGIPARLVHNEAHAWVEVFDTEIWHRIDLGGAASDLRPTSDDPLLVRHLPPEDPLSWPTSERSAAVEFERRLTQMENANAGSTNHHKSTSTEADTLKGQATSRRQQNDSRGGEPHGSITDAASVTGEPPSDVNQSTITIELHVEGEKHLRGSPFAVSGRATTLDQVPCALSRIDIQVALVSGWTTVGSVATNRDGLFKGQVTLPGTLPVGGSAVRAVLGAGCNLAVEFTHH